MLEYRELVWNLTIKEFKLRYRGSILGFLWSLLNPLAMMFILTLVFSTLLPSGIENFPSFLLPPLLAWRFFATGSAMSSWSIVGNSSLVTRTYFPRWLLPLSNSLANLLGSSLEFLALLPLLFFVGKKMSYHVFLTPMVLLMEFVLVFGIALCLSSLNVYYKDVAQLWDLTLQAGFFLCPIIYSTSLIPRRYVFLYSLNPMAGILESLRKIFYYNASPTLSDIIIPLTGSLLILLIGSLIFLRLEPKFAEEV